MALIFYFILLIISPFAGVMIAYLGYKNHKEVGLVMTLGAILSMAFVAIVYPLGWVLLS